jgi:hypothetical protein
MALKASLALNHSFRVHTLAIGAWAHPVFLFGVSRKALNIEGFAWM